ncbi:MAG: hypothetical protein OXG35_32460 [Acidobacteria bacterium]|nr:hypothetical protein [Acidobacteriota bacterium]
MTHYGPTEHCSIREDGTVCIGGRYVRPVVQPRRVAIQAVIDEEEPEPRRWPGLHRRHAISRWSSYRLVRSGVHEAWRRVTFEINGWRSR